MHLRNNNSIKKKSIALLFDIILFTIDTFTFLFQGEKEKHRVMTKNTTRQEKVAVIVTQEVKISFQRLI